jgi:hypothetical protein
MFEEAFLRVGQRIGALQAWVVVALMFCAATLAGLCGLAAYAWYHPAALCRQQSSSLVFGAGLPDGGTVTPEDWARFVDASITARFPDGYTLIDAEGGWRSATTGDTIREPAHVLVLVHPNGRDVDERLDAIVADYKAQFRQESVLRVDTCASVRF